MNYSLFVNEPVDYLLDPNVREIYWHDQFMDPISEIIPDVEPINEVPQRSNSETSDMIIDRLMSDIPKIELKPRIRRKKKRQTYLGYRSKLMLILSLSFYVLSLYSIYKKRENIGYILLFLGSLCQYMDRLYVNRKKFNLISRLREMMKILIKIIIHIILYLLLNNKYVLNNNYRTDFIFVLVPMIMVLGIYLYYINDIIDKLKIDDSKLELYKYIKTIGIILLIGLILLLNNNI